MNYDEIIANAYYGSLDSKADVLTAEEAKIQKLAQRRLEKEERLGLNKQYSNLEKDTHTVMPDGRIESNANKIWNDYNAAESQYIFGRMLADYGLNQNEDGTYTTYDGKPVSAYDARRLYMYGTGRVDDPTTELGTKVGVSSAQASTSDVRYDANIDPRFIDEWRSTDKHSVDLNRKLFDQALDYRAATVLEGLQHGNTRALGQRMYPDYLSDEALQRKSGVSEIYKGDIVNALGDSSQMDLTPERMAELDNAILEYMKMPQAGSKYNLPDFAEIDKQILQDKLDNQTVGDEIGQTFRAGAAGLGKGALDLIDAAQEIPSMLLTGLYNSVTGEKAKHIDLIPNDFKEEAKQWINEAAGYDAELDEHTLQEVKKDFDSIGFEFANPDTWGKLLEGENIKKIGNAGLKVLANPSLTAGMVTEIFGAGGALGATTKVTAKVGSKVAPKLTEKVGELVKTNKTRVNEKYRDKLKNATGDAKEAIKEQMKKEYGAMQKVSDFMKGNVFTNADMAVRVNRDIDEYTKNNNGEGPDATKLAWIVGLNRVASSAEVGSMKLAFTPTKELTQEVKDNLLKALTKTVTHMGKSIGVETLQEGFDTVVETINQKYDAAKYKDKTVADLINDNTAEILTGMVAGGAGGAHMGGAVKLPGAAKKVVGSTLKTVGGKLSDMNKTRIQNAAIEAKAKKEQSRTNTIQRRNIQFSTFTEDKRVEGADTEFVNMNIDGVDTKVPLFEEVDNLKIDSSDAKEYQAKLEEHKDMVVQSLYTLDEKGNISGLTEEAKAMSKEEFETRVNKVNNWLGKYKQEFTVDNKNNMPEMNSEVIESVTLEGIENDTLSEAQKNEFEYLTALKKAQGLELNANEIAFDNKYADDVAKTQKDIESVLKVDVNKDAELEYTKFTEGDAKYFVEEQMAEFDVIRDIDAAEQDLENMKEELAKDETNEELKQRADDLEKRVNEAKKAEQEKNDEMDQNLAEQLAKKDPKVDLSKMNDEEIANVYKVKIEEAITELKDGEVVYNKGWSEDRVKKLADRIVNERKKIIATYNFDEEVEVDVDYKGIIAENKPKDQTHAKNKSVDSTDFNGNDVIEILMGEIESVMEGKQYDTNNSNLQNRVIKQLKNIGQSGIRLKLKNKFTKLLESEEAQAKIAKVFSKTGIENKEVLVLLVNALAAIDTAAAVDTEQRQRVGNNEGTADYVQDEYYAGLSVLVTQIGKDHMTSKKVTFKGSPAAVTAEYRKIGKLAIELLQDAGLVEIRDSLRTVMSSEAVTEKNEKLTSAKGKSRNLPKDVAWTISDEIDAKTGEQLITYADKGIRLVSMNKNKDNNSTTFNKLPSAYMNDLGDVAKRLNQLLLPGNSEVPSNDPNTGEIKVDERASLYEDESVIVAEVIQRLRDVKFRIKPNMLDWLKQVKTKLENDYKNNLDQMISNDKEFNLSELLGIDKLTTESPVLAANERGVSNSLKDELRGILDNLDVLSNGFHYDYQVDVNGRWTVREVVANYQSGKSLSRQLLTLDGKNKNGYEVKDKYLQPTIDAIANELGFAATSEENKDKEYDLLKKYLLENDDHTHDGLKKFIKDNLEYEGDQLKAAVNNFTSVQSAIQIGKASEGDYKKLMTIVVQNTKKGKVLDKFDGKKRFTLVALIDGLTNLRESNGKNTSYMVERDAKASGVFNTLLNILGFDKDGDKNIQSLLERLGVQFIDTDIEKISIIDAYKILQERVEEVINSVPEGIKDAGLEETKTIKALDGIGIDTRELAKPPVMTWFYSAGLQTIVKEFTNTVLTEVVKKALYGDEAALAHINSIVEGEMLRSDVKKMVPGDANYMKLYEEYTKVGELYQKELDTAFPGVTKAKKTIQEMYNNIVDLSQIDGVNYGTEGTIPSAAKALHGDVNSTTNLTGTSSIWKNKEYIQNLSTDDKQKRGMQFSADMKEPMLGNKLMPNVSSTGPIQAQNVDIGQQMEGFRWLFDTFAKGNVGGMSVHDAFYGPVEFGEFFKSGYENSTIPLAINYDFVNNQLIWAKSSLASMKARAKTKQLDADTKEQLEYNIKHLDKLIKDWEAENNARIEYKKAKLKDVETDVLGGLEREVKGQKVKPAVKKKPAPKRTGKTEFKKQVARATEATVIDTETGLGEDTIPYQIGYTTADGESKSISIKGDVFIAATYYGEAKYEAMKQELKGAGEEAIQKALEEKYSEYANIETANTHRLSKDAKTLDEAIAEILKATGEAPVVGFNSAEFDIAKVIVPNLTNEEHKAKLQADTNIDLRLLIQDLRINELNLVNSKELNKGTQSDIAVLAGVNIYEYDTHDAEGDTKLLKDLLNKLNEMSDSELDSFINSLREIKDNAAKAKQRLLVSKFKKDVKKDPKKSITEMVTELAGLGDVKAKELSQLIKDGQIEWIYNDREQSSITTFDDGSAKIVIGKEVEGQTIANYATQLIEVIGHELEHYVTVGKINEIAQGGGAKEEKAAYNFILRVLAKADDKKIGRNTRLGQILSIKDKTTQVKELIATVRGEQNGGPKLLEAMEEAGILARTAERALKEIKKLISVVRKAISKGEFNLKFDENSQLTTDNLVAAVEYIHANEKMNSVNEELSFNTKENEDIIAPRNKQAIDKVMSIYNDKNTPSAVKKMMETIAKKLYKESNNKDRFEKVFSYIVKDC